MSTKKANVQDEPVVKENTTEPDVPDGPDETDTPDKPKVKGEKGDEGFGLQIKNLPTAKPKSFYDDMMDTFIWTI
ncbi:MAG: hypothetical protein KCHDKBKB_02982 [Elusimicrobia bacterium]|nr:hypothetical protein [Elusimicrobiota bacterium]